jgi:hypothetical protein
MVSASCIHNPIITSNIEEGGKYRVQELTAEMLLFSDPRICTINAICNCALISRSNITILWHREKFMIYAPVTFNHSSVKITVSWYMTPYSLAAMFLSNMLPEPS